MHLFLIRRWPCVAQHPAVKLHRGPLGVRMNWICVHHHDSSGCVSDTCISVRFCRIKVYYFICHAICRAVNLSSAAHAGLRIDAWIRRIVGHFLRILCAFDWSETRHCKNFKFRRITSTFTRNLFSFSSMALYGLLYNYICPLKSDYRRDSAFDSELLPKWYSSRFSSHRMLARHASLDGVAAVRERRESLINGIYVPVLLSPQAPHSFIRGSLSYFSLDCSRRSTR